MASSSTRLSTNPNIPSTSSSSKTDNPASPRPPQGESSTLQKLERTAKKIKSLKRPNPQPDCLIAKFLSKNPDESADGRDFETPKKPKPATVKTKPKKAQVKPKRVRNQPDIRKAVMRNSNSDEAKLYNAIIEQSILEDFDPEQLIYSMTLSQSIAETSHTEVDDTTQDQCKWKSTQEKIADIQHTLEKFGFQKGSYTEEDYNRQPVKVPSTRTRRKPVRRKKLDEFYYKTVEEKVRILLQDENIPPIANSQSLESYQLSSLLLKPLQNSENSYYRIQSLGVNQITKFYTGNLFTPTSVKSGALLKDWSLIPGRDVSPIRITVDEQAKETNIEVPETCSDRSGSPDLFAESEEEMEAQDHREITQFESYTSDEGRIVSVGFQFINLSCLF